MKDSHNLKGGFFPSSCQIIMVRRVRSKELWDSPSAKLKPSPHLYSPTPFPIPFGDAPKGMGKGKVKGKAKVMTKATNHRFENCGAFRAFLSPYFRRSLQRESLRRNPFSFKGAR